MKHKNPYPFARPILAAVMAVALVVTGCDAQKWVDIAIKDAPVVLQIVVSILNIVDVKTVPEAQSAGAEAQKDLALVSKLLGDYKGATDPAAKNKALNDLQAALTAANTDISAILSAIHIKDPQKQAAITAGIGVALSTLLSIEVLIPVAQGKAPLPVINGKTDGRTSPPTKVKAEYNEIIGKVYPEAVIK